MDPHETKGVRGMFEGSGLRAAIEGRTIDDDALSDLIAGDAVRERDAGRGVGLDRYLRAVPELSKFPIALDTAIEVALESMARTDQGGSAETFEQRLVAEYPGLAAQIRSAAALSRLLRSTSVVEALAGGQVPLTPPCDFGPVLPSGAKRYDLRSVLGKGSQGVVYLATDRTFADPMRGGVGYVAVKLLKAQGVGDARRLDRLDEAIRARRVNHPNVVTVLDRGECDGVYYAVYEYVPGENLESVGAKRTFDPREAALLVAQIADGVQAVHSVGLVHCDLKPANVLIGQDGTPKITDFGISTHQRSALRDTALGAHAGTGPQTQTSGGAYGTLGFMAPEQHRRPGGIAPAADVYALGGLLFWLLTKKPPNGVTLAQAREVIERASAPGAEAPWVRSINPRVDRDLEAICRVHSIRTRRPVTSARPCSRRTCAIGSRTARFSGRSPG